MLTRPLGVSQYTAPGMSSNTIPVRPGDWKYLCSRSVADALLARIMNLPNVTASIVDVDPNDFYWSHKLEGTESDVRQFEIHGQMNVGGNIFNITETAGWLSDRETKPDASVDRPRSSQGDQALGGPNLKYDMIDSGDLELYWGH